MSMSSVTDDVKTTVGELVKAVTAEHTMSEPIEIGDNVVITINRMGLGFGMGKGGTKVGQGNQGEGERHRGNCRRCSSSSLGNTQVNHRPRRSGGKVSNPHKWYGKGPHRHKLRRSCRVCQTEIGPRKTESRKTNPNSEDFLNLSRTIARDFAFLGDRPNNCNHTSLLSSFLYY